MAATEFTIEIQPKIPERLERLGELAHNLRFSWDRTTRSLFARLNTQLWEAVGHNPKVFLRRVEERRLQQAAEDPVYLDSYDRAVSRFDTYLRETPRADGATLGASDLVAYFSAEFGFHESFQIYSGGLGILAADQCKAASDMGLPFVAVGLLYRQGYFQQTIDGDGNQHATYMPSDVADLPVSLPRDADGEEIRVRVNIGQREVVLRPWLAEAGRVRLILLDSDVPENAEADRRITYQLYGGDIDTRIKQEIVLGIGGVRALRALGLEPTVWHINEGHAAFSVLERCREFVTSGLDLPSALEAVASATVFTTHTPVPAGHDVFSIEMIDHYLGDIAKEMGLGLKDISALGLKPGDPGGFNQTALAIRGSRYDNGVSRIHRDVSAQLLASMWPQLPPDESPLSYVTNGVHVGTFLAREWVNLFDTTLGAEWRGAQKDPEFWYRLDTIPDQLFWSVRQQIKANLITELRNRLTTQFRRNGVFETQIERTLRLLNPDDPNVLLVGFARRFATYKRATLLLTDPERFARIVNDPERPVVFIFAGKAHPADMPGQDMIRKLYEASREPQFDGRILLVEGYDLSLARHMVSGVDVWLNTPRYPLEASGTSGQKAGINAVLNLSVLDGWWGEGYDGHNGWGIRPYPVNADIERRDREEAANLYDIIEHEVLPLYYERHALGYSKRWVEKSKRSMRTLLPRFSASRMVAEYTEKFYQRAAEHGRKLTAAGGAAAVQLAAWKANVRAKWDGVGMRLLDEPPRRVSFGSHARIETAVNLNGLAPQDVRIECLFGDHSYQFVEAGPLDAGEHRFTLDLRPEHCGLVTYRIRMYPFHELLAHPHEVGLMIWLSHNKD
ncbi:MAG TPA: alpha-glucan family phosphorylase [Candidatus Eremiobacteraceae bacterium]|nr:alpha-glucan family phosphorylase [Candidatus Eremiobacteraceae bacterium]